MFTFGLIPLQPDPPIRNIADSFHRPAQGPASTPGRETCTGIFWTMTVSSMRKPRRHKFGAPSCAQAASRLQKRLNFAAWLNPQDSTQAQTRTRSRRDPDQALIGAVEANTAWSIDSHPADLNLSFGILDRCLMRLHWLGRRVSSCVNSRQLLVLRQTPVENCWWAISFALIVGAAHHWVRLSSWIDRTNGQRPTETDQIGQLCLKESHKASHIAIVTLTDQSRPIHSSRTRTRTRTWPAERWHSLPVNKPSERLLVGGPDCLTLATGKWATPNICCGRARTWAGPERGNLRKKSIDGKRFSLMVLKLRLRDADDGEHDTYSLDSAASGHQRRVWPSWEKWPPMREEQTLLSA